LFLGEFPEDLVATDKVALIISNRTYAPHMSNLITPHCDAATLAQALIDLKFKTVTLGDLTLEELKFIVKEYKKLLGVGVYAVFYFVGHGFEANGQCYLLPIGASADNYGPEDCLSMDWVLSMFRDQEPALNLILLDICRTFSP
jgi:mucosa-associated lymphoid tissue lymphoma translocation protein 1